MAVQKRDWVAQIPISELKWSASRSSGAGGQHVNRTSSRVTLTFNLLESEAFDELTRARLLEKLQKFITPEGDLQISSQETRSQLQNKKDCLAKLNDTLERAHYRPKKRKATRPKASAVAKRLKEKTIHKEKKQSRKRVQLRDQ